MAHFCWCHLSTTHAISPLAEVDGRVNTGCQRCSARYSRRRLVSLSVSLDHTRRRRDATKQVHNWCTWHNRACVTIVTIPCIVLNGNQALVLVTVVWSHLDGLLGNAHLPLAEFALPYRQMLAWLSRRPLDSQTFTLLTLKHCQKNRTDHGKC